MDNNKGHTWKRIPAEKVNECVSIIFDFVGFEQGLVSQIVDKLIEQMEKQGSRFKFLDISLSTDDSGKFELKVVPSA
jgi:hypothetical protein